MTSQDHNWPLDQHTKHNSEKFFDPIRNFFSTLLTSSSLFNRSVYLNIRWLRKHVSERLEQDGVSKVAFGVVQKLLDDCDSNEKNDELKSLMNAGYSFFIVNIDSDNKVIEDVEFIKDKKKDIDKDILNLIGEELMVIIEK